MARPQIKADLLISATENYQKLLEIAENLTENERNTPFDFSSQPKKKEAHWARDKNLRDVLVHLYEWHQLLLNWVKNNQAGEAKPFIPEPYTFKTYGDMNIEFFKKHQATSLEDAKTMLQSSHQEVMNLIDNFTNEELFTKKYFNWTGTTSLGSYCISATSSHYDWATKKLKVHKKILKA